MQHNDNGRRVGIFFDNDTIEMVNTWRVMQRPVLTFSQAVRALMWSGYRVSSDLRPPKVPSSAA